MKIFFNAAVSTNYGADLHKNKYFHQDKTDSNKIMIEGVGLANDVKYMTFKAKPDSTMLLAQSDKFLCAYSRKHMLNPYTFRSIVSKLTKKTTAQSAINFLREYQYYMPKVETEIFDMLEEYGASGKRTFQDTFIEKRPEALIRLRQKQTNILHSTDDYIFSLQDEELAEQLLYTRDAALIKVSDGTFGRSEVLEQLNNIVTDDKNEKEIHEMYKSWYKLPRALKDYDAFIVKYSKFPHNEIAQRLLSMSIASVEHVTAYANGGQDVVWNYVLTQMLYNKDKGDMNLAEYDELNPDIEIQKNLPMYINDVCNEIKCGNTYFITNNSYPEKLRENIIEETGWKTFMPKFVMPQLNMRNNTISGSKKGANRYRTYHK